ncbi:MAG: energy-coupling factor transporter transmembrane protein EcfT [Thermoproteota archaeon]|jgi:energy-coupling factor transport system permease protein|uniref:Energy-coupling factor transporter transmembrane protein EcfT n=1 Tax=Candidatus Methanodesulfokora washburnensis TaxID=2478471 RepID=A0A3R9QWQ2_9CREN|nr:energy-coupling factor transporter transmembrane component T [Candidatus Methanodesulfokores washburnensis]RSN75267.1 energy-coupling factor transporter transmembrane protein EcfT [Candidatus Methanodesulfokores washburnensis]TDA42174.1 MAG: energy-coupling factor transporter transmembrane protein EcfT [Candidatus Korarchaeota archaeon]
MSTRFIKYVEGDSTVHKLDPRAKLTFLFFLVSSLTVSYHIFLVIPLLLISLLFYFLAKLPWNKTKGTWKFILTIILVLSLLNYLTIVLLYSKGPLTEVLTSPDALRRALTPVLKLLALAVATVTVVFTTPPNLYAPALGQMGFPYKAAYIIQLALRYIPEFIAEMNKTLEAQMARGFRPRGGRNPLAKLFSIIPLVVPVTISATLSIYDIADSMELRGFGEESCHTWYRELKLTGKDKFLVIASYFLGAVYITLFILNLISSPS